MVTITFGLNNSVSKTVAEYPTVAQILGDANLRQFLGFGGNVEARVNGVSAQPGTNLQPGDTVELVTKANVKG